MDVFFVWCNIFVICGLPYMIKYSALGDAKYSPHTDDCGYMAPFSVSRIRSEEHTSELQSRE